MSNRNPHKIGVNSVLNTSLVKFDSVCFVETIPLLQFYYFSNFYKFVEIVFFLKFSTPKHSFFFSFCYSIRNIILTRSLGGLTDFLIQYLYTGNSLHTMIHKTKQQRKEISKTEKLLTEVSLVQGAILKDWFMSGHCARFGCCCRVDFTLPIFNFSYIFR